MRALFSPELWPFALAAGLLLGLTIVEAAALWVGASPSHWIDAAIGADQSEGAFGALLGWLHVGAVPLLVLLVVFLTAFAMAGFGSQLAMRSITGAFMPGSAAAAIAFVAGVGAVRILGPPLRWMVPQDETTAVPDASLVGRVGTVVIGTAVLGRPAEVRVRDELGTIHYVMAEPEEADQSFTSGTSVLLVRHLNGRRFHVIQNPKPELL